MAITNALKIVDVLGMGNIVVKIDSINLRSSLIEEMGNAMVVVKHARMLLSLNNFHMYHVTYCLRECNRVAHQLAKLGASLESFESCYVWLKDFLEIVSDHVANESVGLHG